MTLTQVSQEINSLKRIDLQQVDSEILLKKLNYICLGFANPIPIVSLSQRLFRGQIVHVRPENVTRLGPPPAENIINYQRANMPGAPMFYCSISPESVFYELGCKPSNLVALTEWRPVKSFTVNSVGYSKRILDKLGTERLKLPYWVGSLPAKMNSPTNRIINDFLAEEFCRIVKNGNEWQYKITATITQFLIHGIKDSNFKSNDEFRGIVYPSLASFANSDNLALLPDSSTKFLEQVQTELYRVEEVFSKGHFRVTLVDSAPNRDADGRLQWNEKPVHLGVLPSTAKATLGEDGRWRTN